jgi:hypothetical protein
MEEIAVSLLLSVIFYYPSTYNAGYHVFDHICVVFIGILIIYVLFFFETC